ncbi:PT domain-containing protein [Actinomadura rupiterrae]|uniref:PT domain-containing protein n=1 Tax=Actinomadura rupiterrae TaxID=559627 RepID=UPI0020A582A2|nr:PT domain-containing protein [Actinomadura rupiterrae]MCP2335807.1 cell division septation protein DedD [Actinomadura rupiterrae]
MAQRKLPDLSATQLIASGAATMIAAYGASYLGVYGTILGAAFMSVVSTAASVVGKHYLDEGKEQIKERTALIHGEHVAGVAADAATGLDATRAAGASPMANTRVAGAPSGWSPPPGRWAGGDPNRTRVEGPFGPLANRSGGGDPNATRLDPSTQTARNAQSAANAQATRNAQSVQGIPDAHGDPNATRFDASALDVTRLDRTPAETVADELAAAQAGRTGVSWRDAVDESLVWAQQRWKMLTASAVVVFVVVIGGITLYESLTDKTFGGVKGGGGTIGNVFKGQNEGGQRMPSHAPSHTPSETPTTPTTGGPGTGNPTNQPSNQPSGGPTEKPTQTPTTPQSPTHEPTSTPTHEPTTAPSTGGATGNPGGQAPPKAN